MSSPLVSPPVAKAKSLFCPNCGGPIEVRGFGRSLSVVCPQCLSVLDASTPMFKILQQIQEAQRRQPAIPLGTRAKLANATWEVIGFQTREIDDEGDKYEWREYLLFNPYKGFRYLTEYDGHWNYVTPLESMPDRLALSGRPAVSYTGRRFKHFSAAQAATTFVLGEFPWRVTVGERVLCDDYVDPPTMMSSETTKDEVTWSQGEYIDGRELWKVLNLQGSPPSTRGIYSNQPSPFRGKVASIWTNFLLMIGFLIALAIFFAVFSGNRKVLDEHYHFPNNQAASEQSFVTKVFDLEGRPAALELEITTNLSNDWAYFNFGLINQDTGEAYDFGREVSAYNGTDSDGSWSEGSPSSSVMIPAVPPGKYYLWVEPEMDTSGQHSMYYALELKHDVPSYSWFWLAAVLLFIPPVWYSIRARAYETRRWMQSDYPPITKGGGD